MGVDTRDSYRSTVNTLAILPMARILFRITSFLAAIVAPANDRQASIKIGAKVNDNKAATEPRRYVNHAGAPTRSLSGHASGYTNVLTKTNPGDDGLCANNTHTPLVK